MDYSIDSAEIEKIGHALIEIFKEYYINPDSVPVIKYANKRSTVEKYYRKIPPDKGIGLEKTIEMFRKDVMPDSVKTFHPAFMNQMTSGASFPSVITSSLETMINSTLATWEISPVATVIERMVAEWMARLLGMPEGSSGIFLPGGSVGNLVALTVARNQKLGAGIGRGGLKSAADRVILCSESAHYSLENAMDILGLGSDNIIKVKTNDRNEMLVDDFVRKLEWCKRNAKIPFAAVLIAGSTVTGGIDPIPELAKICKEEDLYIHIDAAFGGGASLTSEGKELLRGIDQADSVCWNAHKWLHSPLTCTALLFPDATILKSTFQRKADYLFHPQDEIEEKCDDLGLYTLLCGKRLDALKLWLMWHAYGMDHLRKLADERLQLAHDFYEILNDSGDFIPAYEPRTPVICFRYSPSSWISVSAADSDLYHRKIREEMKKRGKAFFNVIPLNGRKQFRTVLINPLTDREHLTDILNSIRKISTEIVKL